MKFLKPLSLLALAAVFLPACASLNSTGVDRRLAPPKTYDFLPDKAITAAEEAGVSNAPYWHQQVEASIDAQLKARGYARTQRSQDLLVAFHVISQHGKTVTLLDNYAGYQLSAKEQAEQAEIANFLKVPGAKDRQILIVDVIDPSKREIIWREWVQAPDKHPTRRRAAKQQRAIDRAVGQIMSNFPPKA